MERNEDMSTFTEAELARLTGQLAQLRSVDSSVLHRLGHKDSKRGKRRAMAFLIGHANDGRIDANELRRACIDAGLYVTRGDKANWALDINKDCKRGLFVKHTYRSGRSLVGHWQLTERGAALAAEYARAIARADEHNARITERNEAILKQRAAIIETHEMVKHTIKVVAKTPRCGLCWEDITDEDQAKCQCCDHQIHATCRASFGQHTCILGGIRACYGSYKVISMPEGWEQETDDTCSRCMGIGSTPRNVRGCDITPEQIKLVEGDEARAAAQHDHDTECSEGVHCSAHRAHTYWTPCIACQG